MKKNKQSKNNQKLIIIFGSVILVWLTALTVFSAWAWNQHIWQAGVDNDAIYKLTVENANQQNAIDTLIISK